MSGSSYYNYYSQQSEGSYYSETNVQIWGSSWSMQQRQHFAVPPPGYSRSSNNLHSPSSITPSGQPSGYSPLRAHQQYHNSAPPPNTSPRGYQQICRYSTSSYDNDNLPLNSYGNRQQSNWSRHQKYKRTITESGETFEHKSKSSKKKKKSLSQNNPTKKEWSPQEAEMALKVEKELNKRDNQSLLIKFPDLELNREIVAKLHPAIEDVKFHQPHASRSCFVTLTESANTDAVIRELNKQKFGDGHVMAEYKKDNKKDGEDYQNIGPEDIDPTTLYVGNLANNVTVEDIIRIFPKGRRKDVGFAKKMKNTRYAFVCFHTVADAIEALKKTHNTDLHCKSLIVRFRRLNANKTSEINSSTAKYLAIEHHKQVAKEVNNPLQELESPWNYCIDSSIPSPQLSQRNEAVDSDDEVSSVSSVQGDIYFSHKPKLKTEVKIEMAEEPEYDSARWLQQKPATDISSPIIKKEPAQIFAVDERDVVIKQEPKDSYDVEDSGPSDNDNEGVIGVKSFDGLYNNVREERDVDKTG